MQRVRLLAGAGLAVAASLAFAACGGSDHSHHNAPREATSTTRSLPETRGKPPVFTGGTKSFTATLKPGTYTYFCLLPGQRQAGKLRTLTVK
jgi:hypothetical protein